MDRLIKKIIEFRNPTVMGLDPAPASIPPWLLEKAFGEFENKLEAVANAALEFNKGLIDAVCDIIPAVKPQSAYYEMYGFYGVKALYKTIEYAKKMGMYVITDGKRNDIGSTMEAYSAAYIGKLKINGNEIGVFDSDALTVNGYLGTDGIMPLIADCEKYDKDIFVLAKTSNPSSGELQDLKVMTGGDSSESVYELMCGMCRKWGENLRGEYGYSAVGAVVGATYSEQLIYLRNKFPEIFFLVPGYGAQGGGAADVAGAFDKDGLGAVINNSRGIICAYKRDGFSEKEFGEAAREEAIRMKKDIQDVQGA